MAKLSFMKFYPQDWLYDTRILTLEERAVWIDLLCFMWNAKKRGELTLHPQNMAQMVGLEWNNLNVVLDSLESKGVCNLLRNGDATVTLLSRRMLRDGYALEKNRLRVEKYRESSRLRMEKYRSKTCNANVMDKKLEAKKLEAIKDTTLSPGGDDVKPSVQKPTDMTKETDVQKVIKGWKMLNDLPLEGPDSQAWDRVHFPRYARSAKSLLNLFGYEGAINCMEYVFLEMSKKKLTCTIETIVKHSDIFREQLARRGR